MSKTTIPASTVRNELRRIKAIGYLKSRGIYRGDRDCDHEYRQHDPEALRDLSVTVTVCRVMSATVSHVVRA